MARPPSPRDPGDVPDLPDVRGAAAPNDHSPDGVAPDPVRELPAAAVDTDHDGLGDTVTAMEGADLVVRTDLDADGLIDRTTRIGAGAEPLVQGPAPEPQIVSPPGPQPDLPSLIVQLLRVMRGPSG